MIVWKAHENDVTPEISSTRKMANPKSMASKMFHKQTSTIAPQQGGSISIHRLWVYVCMCVRVPNVPCQHHFFLQVFKEEEVESRNKPRRDIYLVYRAN